MAIPAIYLDECFNRRLALRLRASGIDVVTVAEVAATGNDDESQLQQEIIHGFRLPDWDDNAVRDAVGWQ